MINRKRRRVKFGENKQTCSAKGVPFEVTYHSMPKSLGKTFHNNIHLLYMNEEVRSTFTPGSMISFRTQRKICSYLVRAKLNPLKRIVGSSKCG